MKLNVIILAAGKGTRMRSSLPKVLHKLADKSLVEHVVATAQSLAAEKTVVVFGHGGEIVPKTLSHLSVEWEEQVEQLGTGHAVEQGLNSVDDASYVLVLYGDVPLTTKETLEQLLSVAKENEKSIGLLTARLHDPTGYGRIVRDENGAVCRIVEQKDASNAELKINEINTGILCAEANILRQWLKQLENNNAQGEFYLTDVIEMAVKDGYSIKTHLVTSLWEIEGVNNKRQLAALERQHQRLLANQLMDDGVSLRDPSRIDIRGSLTTGLDCSIDINTLFEGDVILGNSVSIGANTVIVDSIIGDNVSILANCVIENATIASHCSIGPFSRIRPETKLAEGVRIGNFVEIKKANIAEGSKINHLSYIGDTNMGRDVNIGAGTITCNYDGANKHVTEIGDNVFVGSDTQLIAPVRVGNGATIGAGSTITKDIPECDLALSRIKQTNIKGWSRPVKKS